MATDLVVLTVAAGKQSSLLVPILCGKHPLRLVVNSSSSLRRLEDQYPQAEVVQADMTLAQDCRRIVKGASTVYHIGPSFHPREAEIGYNMIDAAIEESRSGHLKHFIYSSVIQIQLRKLMNHDCKRYVEEYLMESTLNWTILRPSHFLDSVRFNGLIVAHNQGHEPIFRAFFSPETRFCFSTYDDYAESSAKIIKEGEEHYLATYDLVSTKPLSYRNILEIMSQELGKKVVIEQMPLKKAADMILVRLHGSIEEAEKKGLYSYEGPTRMLLYYDRHGLSGNVKISEAVLGRKTTSAQEWLCKLIEDSK